MIYSSAAEIIMYEIRSSLVGDILNTCMSSSKMQVEKYMKVTLQMC